MELYANEGADCTNCAYQGGKDIKQCKICARKDGRLGWDPAPGVQTQVVDCYMPYKRGNKNTKIRKVIN